LRASKSAIVSAAVLVLLAGCGQSADPVSVSTPGAAVATTAAADPVQRLKDSTKGIAALNYRFTFKGETMIGNGYVHDPTHGLSLDFTDDASDGKSAWQTRVVDGAALVRVTVDGKPFTGGGKWLKLDQDKARTTDLMAYIGDLDGDVPGGGQILATATDVIAAQSGDITGMVDLSKQKGILVLDAEPLDTVSASINQIPFIATLDTQGRLTKLVLDMVIPSAGQLTPIEFDYTDYGTVTPDPAPAASQVTAAPNGFYEFLND
jgi:hypothetical protein